MTNMGLIVGIAAGVGTAIGVALNDTAVGFGVGFAIFILFRVFGNSQDKGKKRMNQKQVIKRYYKEFGISMGFYTVAVIASITALNNFEFPQIVQVIITLIPVIPVIFVVIAIMRALRDSDELQQKIQLQAVTFSAITTGLITFSYGFLENVGLPPFPTIWILPIMFFLWGVSLGYFWKQYK